MNIGIKYVHILHTHFEQQKGHERGEDREKPSY